ncbi:hypothetical protein [Teredinibacter waterburyi]|uniref:hypothetical protein n=1 Tax=Teredinibacter waterburyi TaxID=1500538 RepID=UPI00165F737B|nr:hypothetical protein [Teredinibacter waterburyi]
MRHHSVFGSTDASPLAQLKIYGSNGDCWAHAASTVESCWSALGAGADGLHLKIFATKTGELVCAPANQLQDYCGDDVCVSQLQLRELQQLDAGYSFRSTQLDERGQATGVRGDDTPWRALRLPEEVKKSTKLKDRAALRFLLLEDALTMFGRRAELLLQLPNDDYPEIEQLAQNLVAQLGQFGLVHRCKVIASEKQCRYLLGASSNPAAKQTLPESAIIINAGELKVTAAIVKVLVEVGAKALLVNIEQLMQLNRTDLATLSAVAEKANLHWYIQSTTMPYAPSPAAVKALARYSLIIMGYLTMGVLPTVERLRPRAETFSEDFAGRELNLNYWRAGYSHINQETELSVHDGFIIRIAEGKQYSGGAAMLTLPLNGDFDASVAFAVLNPHQATTFELAAIAIDPGYHNMNNSKLNTRNVNLTFDVHGAPPYASSERDQNDAFRCGWNNSYNLTKIGVDQKTDDPDVKPNPDKAWEASSVNMYNKYGRGVGDGSKAVLPDVYATGYLRLVRSGTVFNSYYRDGHNQEWVCSGSMLVSSMPEDCFLRLAAKHWAKVKPAPSNEIVFREFSLRQPC